MDSIVKAIPEPVNAFGRQIIGKCYDKLILDQAILKRTSDPDTIACIRLSISKAIGIGIVSASSVVKIPQITALLKSKSAAGLSALSTALECVAYTGTLAYSGRLGLPFSTYGESGLILIQDLALLALILIYSGRGKEVFVAFPAVLMSIGWAVVIAPNEVVNALYALTIPIGLASKIPQIQALAETKSAGNISLISVIAYFGGALARVFTSAQEVDDLRVLASAVAAAILNGVVLAQVLYYGNKVAPIAAEKKNK
ncbi:hypothetical protein V1511DRAFT_495309 [Dipodascopsis uninucleata]